MLQSHHHSSSYVCSTGSELLRGPEVAADQSEACHGPICTLGKGLETHVLESMSWELVKAMLEIPTTSLSNLFHSRTVLATGNFPRYPIGISFLLLCWCPFHFLSFSPFKEMQLFPHSKAHAHALLWHLQPFLASADKGSGK